MPLTQELVIIEAMGLELQILGTAVIFLEAEVLGSARAFDTPYHLRASYDKELINMLEAGIIEPMGLQESDWCSRAFPVLKSDGSSVRVVMDFKNINRCIKRPINPTDSSSQLL